MKVNLEYVFSNYIDHIDSPIIAVETGCSFYWVPESEEYLSTPSIIKHLVAPTGGKLYSFDNDPDKVDICKFNLKRLGLDSYVEFKIGDSVKCINNLDIKGINFVWLDSSENAEHAMDEYNALIPKMASKNIICVDDYGCENSVKWQGVSDIITKTFDIYSVYNTPTGLIVGYNKGPM